MALPWSVTASPGRTLLFSMIAIIIVGTLLLALPAAQVGQHNIIDVLFTATSATCVTGLLTIPLSSFTHFGQIIILALIQIGGLGLITMTVFLVSLFFTVGIKTHLMAGQLLELKSWKNSKRIITFIIALTVIVELLGAFLLYFTLPAEYLTTRPWFTVLFHSISSFCSAGFSIFTEGLSIFEYNFSFLLITGLLIFIGELGFITWHEISHSIRSFFTKKHFRLSLHSRIILSYSITLILITTALFGFLEYHNIFTENSFFYAIGNSLFQAISLRSCGLTTIATGTLQLATYFLIMIITFIGSSPGSTGSGIKITSFALLLATVRSVIMGRTVVEIRGRKIPNDQIFKVMAVFALALMWIAFTIFVLLITERHQGYSFLSIVFESFAAFANLGISLNVTPTLSLAGKIIVIISMILGRIGALTLILAIKKQKETTEFQYPTERVMLS